MTTDRTMWRRVLAFDLGLFNVALFFFAWLPPDTLVWPERIAMVGSAAACVGVVAHAVRRVNIPGEGWSYLITACVGFYVLLVYAHTAPAPWSVKAPFLLFLASGIASGLAAHVIDGGPGRG
jgi:hypothetical protein